MAADDVLGDGEAEAGAAQPPRAGRVDAVEALGQPREMLAGDARALIDDADADAGAAGEPARSRPEPPSSASASIRTGLPSPPYLMALSTRLTKQLMQLVGDRPRPAAGRPGSSCERHLAALRRAASSAATTGSARPRGRSARSAAGGRRARSATARAGRRPAAPCARPPRAMISRKCRAPRGRRGPGRAASRCSPGWRPAGC